ncbi:hypothetical protein [uncultured Parvibaculum sp.]|uniref:hypothetical protein n=1 Tax=uncultured Parvibaculum sp. TaxID=291828 RepID=UPI0030D85183|tara:strand:+ start:36593 stop:41887 length:5295 start_codon:yes stop_codon:yes gene_type:complete
MKLFGIDIPLPDPGTPAGMIAAGAGGAAAVAGAAMLAMAAFGDDDMAPVELAGKWEVAYHDRILGRVTGRATVDEGEGGAEVVLTHPKTGEKYTLRSTRFARAGDMLNVTLEGQWPGAEGYVEPPLGEEKAVGAGSPYEWSGPEKITLAHGDSEETFRVLKDEPVGKHKVELELYIGEEALTGSWKQWANAVTGRDESDGGRIADFRFAGDGTGRAFQTGTETWYRPRPVIHLVTPTADQLSIVEYLGARYPYPWDAKGAPVKRADELRYLLVVGDELPTEVGEKIKLESLDDDIEYFVRAKQSDYADDVIAREMLENGFSYTKQQLKRQMLADGIGNDSMLVPLMAEIYKKDWVILGARLKRPAMPGRKGFKLNGAEGSWVLRHGDFVADFAVVRAVGDETEGADHVLIPEKIYLELRTTALFPFDEIPVQLWVNDTPHLFGNSRTIMAKRLPRTKEDDEALAELREAVRFAGGEVENVKPVHIYRTPPIGLVDKGQEASGGAMDLPDVSSEDWRVQVKDGDVIQGVNAAVDKLRTEPFHAKAVAVNSPAEIVRHVAPALGNAQNLTWTRAVAEAARCTGIPFETPVDFDALARRKAKTFSNTVLLDDAAKRATGKQILGDLSGYGRAANLLADLGASGIQSPSAFSGGKTYSLDMRVGDHAAMLILREAFIEMMTRQIEELSAITSDDALYGFRASAEIPSSYAPNHPFADIDVRAPNGQTVYYPFSYAGDALLKTELGLDAEAAEAWRLDATRQLLRQHIAALREARAKAQAIKTCGEHQKLVDLTGRGFAAVNRYARSRLMTAQSVRGERDDAWKADRVARAWLNGVPVFAEALAAQQELSAQDTKLIMTAVAIGTSGAALGGGLVGWATGFEALFFSTAATLGDIGNAAHALYTQVGHKLNTSAEVRFARNAHAVLGDARLEQALAEDRHWAEISAGLYLDVVPSLVFTSGTEFLKGLSDIGSTSRSLYRGGKRLVSQARSIARGRQILGEVGVGTGVSQATPPKLVQIEPPKIPAEDFARDFPDGKDVQRASSIELDDLIDPANPGKLPDIEDLNKPQSTPPAPPRGPPDPAPETAPAPGPAADAGDTILEGTPGPPSQARPAPSPAPAAGADADDTIRVGQPGDGASPATGAEPQRLPEAEAASANADQLDRLRRDADAAYERSQQLAQEAFAQNRAIDAAEGNELLKGAHTAAAQEVVETAVDQARRAGLSESEIHAIISKYDVTSGRGDLMRFALVDELQRVSVQRLGYELVDDLYAQDVMELVTRSYTGAAEPADLARLKVWIDRAADAGEDFFSRLQRQGTYTDLDGFENLADADGIASLRKLAADNDLLPMGLLETQALTASERLAESSIGRIRNLPEPQRIDVMNAIFDARRIAAEAGVAALDATERAALRIGNDVVGDAGGVPAWARGLDRASYERIAHLGRRTDVHSLIEADPSLLRQIADDPDIRAAIELQAYRDPADFRKVLAAEQKRTREPLAGAFTEAKDDHWLPKQVMKDGKEQPVAFKHELLEGDGKKFSTDKLLSGGDEVAVIERELGPADLPEFAGARQMTWSYMEAKLLPDFFDNVNVPMIKGRGTSSAAMLNMRAFHNLDIPYGDPSLKLVKMSNVENANTSVQIAWMKRVYGKDWTRYLKNTHSVRYAESALNQAGFRIKEVRLGSTPPLRMNARGMVEGTFFKAKEKPMEFLARYGVSPNEAIETGHDIYIVVEPFGAAPPRSASAAPRRRRRALSGWRPARRKPRISPLRAGRAQP